MTLDWLKQRVLALRRVGSSPQASTLDAERWIYSFWLPDAILFFGNAPPCCGHNDLLAATRAQFSDLASLEFEILTVDVLPSRTYATQIAHYRVRDDPDDERISVNQLLVYYRAPSDARISRCDTFADLGRLREKIHARHAVLAARVSTPGSTVPDRAEASP